MISIIISGVLMYSAILLLVALGGMFSERSGIINIGLEGIMIIGALAGAITLVLLPKDMLPFIKIIFVFITSAIAGLIYSLLLSFAAINLKADQTIGGTALNVLGAGLAVVLAKNFNGITGDRFTNSYIKYSYEWAKTMFFYIGDVRINYFFPLAIIILIISIIVLYKTKFGLRLRACGENPQAADSLGVNVTLYRYLGTSISGILAGIGGASYCLVSASRWDFATGVCGFGFLALAVMIFGQWRPFRIFLAALFFSIFKTIAVQYSNIPFLANLSLGKNIYEMLPFIASLFILILSSKNSKAPKAEGIPYDKGKR